VSPRSQIVIGPILTHIRRRTRLQHELLSQKLCSFHFENNPDSVGSDLLLNNPIYRSGVGQILSRTPQHGSNYPRLGMGQSTNEASNSSNSRESDSSFLLVARTGSSPDLLPPKRRGAAKKLVSFSRWESIFGEVIAQKSCHSTQSANVYEVDGSPVNQVEETETSFFIRPSKWLLRLGLNFEACAKVSWSLSGWNVLQQTYRVVPTDSLIFQSCRCGDIESVRQLFSQGKASVWDIDVHGRTPLHVSLDSTIE
jgi:hypothetical protein